MVDENGYVLLTKREKNTHLAGYWEFPGGKLNDGESFKQALRRELAEEIGFTLHDCHTLINFKYVYSDRQLHFQVFKLAVQRHTIVNNEGQNIQWLQKTQLHTVKLPAANKIILNALLMPNLYAIADANVFADDLLLQVERQLKAGAGMIQYRTQDQASDAIMENGLAIKELCDEYNALMVLNSEWHYWDKIQPHGVHVKSADLARLKQLATSRLNYRVISASCHTSEQARMINSMEIDSALVGSVNTTMTHPQQKPLGWTGFSKLCAHIDRPVYAIGGCRVSDIITSQVYGGHGIAAIRGIT